MCWRCYRITSHLISFQIIPFGHQMQLPIHFLVSADLDLVCLSKVPVLEDYSLMEWYQEVVKLSQGCVSQCKIIRALEVLILERTNVISPSKLVPESIVRKQQKTTLLVLWFPVSSSNLFHMCSPHCDTIYFESLIIAK